MPFCVCTCRCFSLREASLSITRIRWRTSLRDITTTTGRRRTWTGCGKAWRLWAESTSCFWSNTSWRWEKCTKTRNRRSKSDPISFHVCFFTLSSVLIDLLCFIIFIGVIFIIRWKQVALIVVFSVVRSKNKLFLPSSQIQKKWDQNDKADPEKQPALEESDLKPTEGETKKSSGGQI